MCLAIAGMIVPFVFANAQTSTDSTISLSDLEAQIAALTSQISGIMGSLKNVQTEARGLGMQGRPLPGAQTGNRNPLPTQLQGNMRVGKITAIDTTAKTLTLEPNGIMGFNAQNTTPATTVTVNYANDTVKQAGQTSPSLAVGQMVSVTGDKDSTGTITASAIEIIPTFTTNPGQGPEPGKSFGLGGNNNAKPNAGGIFGGDIFSQLNPTAGANVPTEMTLIGLSGTVSAISADGKTLTVDTTYAGTPSYSVTGGLGNQIANIKTNDAVTVIGQLTSTNGGNSVTAIMIRDTTKNQ